MLHCILHFTLCSNIISNHVPCGQQICCVQIPDCVLACLEHPNAHGAGELKSLPLVAALRMCVSQIADCAWLWLQFLLFMGLVMSVSLLPTFSA